MSVTKVLCSFNFVKILEIRNTFQIRQGRENGLLPLAKSDSPSNSALGTDLGGLTLTSKFGKPVTSVTSVTNVTDVTYVPEISKFGKFGR